MTRFLAVLWLGLLSSACGDSDSQIHQPAKVLGIELKGRVVDSARVLSSETEKQLTTQLAALEAKATDQVVVVTLPSLKGHTIEEVGLTLGRGWGIGRKDVDNGVLLLVAPNERKTRIEVGYGLEGLLTDDRAAEVVRTMLPKFRMGDIAGGVSTGVDQIDRLLRSDQRRPQYRSEERKEAA